MEPRGCNWSQSVANRMGAALPLEGEWTLAGFCEHLAPTRDQTTLNVTNARRPQSPGDARWHV